MNWLNRNKYRLALAAAIGVVAFIIAVMPTEASLPESPPFPEWEDTCETRVNQVMKPITIIKVENQPGYDSIYVFQVDGEIIIATVEKGCIVGAAMG